ncbi:MAG: hypothetical protein ACYTEQ_19405 [Planctomycetota bacterium]
MFRQTDPPNPPTADKHPGRQAADKPRPARPWEYEQMLVRYQIKLVP